MGKPMEDRGSYEIRAMLWKNVDFVFNGYPLLMLNVVNNHVIHPIAGFR